MLKNLSILGQTWQFELKAVQEKLKKLRIDLIVPKLKEIGTTFTKTDSIEEQKLRTALFRQAVFLGVPEYIEMAKEMYRQYISGNEQAFHANYKSAAFISATMHGSEEDWNNILGIYKKPVVTDDNTTALGALLYTPNMELKKKVYDFVLDGTIRTQDVYYLFGGTCLDAESSILAFNWVTENWTEICRFSLLLLLQQETCCEGVPVDCLQNGNLQILKSSSVTRIIKAMTGNCPMPLMKSSLVRLGLTETLRMLKCGSTRMFDL